MFVQISVKLHQPFYLKMITEDLLMKNITCEHNLPLKKVTQYLITQLENNYM